MDMKVDNLNVFYKEMGKGKNILILHGWGVNHKYYESIYKHLSKNNKVYILDLPGFGSSDEPTYPWDINDYVLFIKKFIKKNDIKDLSLIGHSFGGRIIIKMLSSKCDFNVKSVVLMDSAGIIPKKSFFTKVKIKTYKILKAIVFNKLVMKIFPNFLNKIKNNLGSADYKNASVMMREILVKTVNEDLTPYLKNIKVPTLIVWGENDTTTPYGDALIMEKEISNSGIATIKGAGHMPFLDNPVLVNNILDVFFKEEK